MARAKGDNIFIKIKYFLGLRYILSLLRETEERKLQGTLLKLYVVSGGKVKHRPIKRAGICVKFNI